MEGALPDPNRIRPQRTSSAVSAFEPPWVFALKSLLNPLIVVGCLLVCLAVWGQPLRGPYFLVAVLAFLASSELLDVIQPTPPRGPRRAVYFSLVILARWGVVVAFIWGLLHLTGLTGLFHMHLLTSWALITPAVLCVGDSVARRLLCREHMNSARVRKAVIVGLTEPGLRLEQHLKDDRSLRMHVAGFFEDRGVERLPAQGIDRVLGKQADLPAFVRDNDINVAYVTLPMTHNARVMNLLEQLRDSTVSVYFVPNLLVFEPMQARFDFVNGMPVVAIRESPLFGASSIGKRVFDLVAASLLTLLFAPIMLLIAAGIRLTSAGPIIFKQRRCGLDGREILIYKFRSMTVTEDGHAQYLQVSRNDVRVTPLGAWLRRLSLDELPQLFNVLGGSLSLVGPRPHAMAVNEQYRKLIPGYMLRHKIKPGITGWAQVNGYRGGDDLESMRKRIDFDMEYLRNWSLLLDLAIVLQTATVVWRDKRAY